MFMKTIGGVKVKNVVKRALSRLFTNKLAMNIVLGVDYKETLVYKSLNCLV